MAVYRLKITRSAERQIESLPSADRRAVVTAIQGLAVDPRPRACRKLQGSRDAFRLRVRRYRVIYVVDDATITVLVLKVGHRKDVYRDLD
ncbi:MAG: type II toxin-antitoxin system RelE family toxin [Myxococcota bacterium]